MGAPKQKWTPDEEAALKAGVLKHGPGKWRTILKDQEFSGVLSLRSNVDLKDKWRNMSVMANGWGSRERARLALKRMHQAPKPDENLVNRGNAALGDEKSADSEHLATSSGSAQIAGAKRSIIRLDNLIMEAINNLKQPGGSDKAAIAEYIEDAYWAPPNFKRLLSAKLKYMTSSGKLVKMRRKFRAPNLALSDRKRPYHSLLEGRLEGKQRVKKSSPVNEVDDVDVLSRSEVDLDLAKMRNMTPQEAAASAAQAVAEAEAAIAEAEEAAREAEAAEADAEAAHAFAEAAGNTLRGSAPRMMVRA